MCVCVCVCVCVLRRDTLASSATMHARSMSRILPRRLNHCMWFMSLASKFTEVRQVVVLEAVLGWVDGCNGCGRTTTEEPMSSIRVRV